MSNPDRYFEFLIKALRGRAKAYNMIGAYDESISDFRKIIDLNKLNRETTRDDMIDSMIHIANILAKNKNDSRAAERMIKKLNKIIDPSGRAVQNVHQDSY